MTCCGSSIKRRDEKTLFEELKNNEEEISLKLNRIDMKFIPKDGNWKSNLNY